MVQFPIVNCQTLIVNFQSSIFNFKLSNWQIVNFQVVKHQLSNCQIVKLHLSNCQIVKLSNYQIIKLSNCQIVSCQLSACQFAIFYCQSPYFQNPPKIRYHLTGLTSSPDIINNTSQRRIVLIHLSWSRHLLPFCLCVSSDLLSLSNTHLNYIHSVVPPVCVHLALGWAVQIRSRTHSFSLFFFIFYFFPMTLILISYL